MRAKYFYQLWDHFPRQRSASLEKASIRMYALIKPPQSLLNWRARARLGPRPSSGLAKCEPGPSLNLLLTWPQARLELDPRLGMDPAPNLAWVAWSNT